MTTDELNNRKQELAAAYNAGYEYAKKVEWGATIFTSINSSFEEWYSREIENPPEMWDEHNDD